MKTLEYYCSNGEHRIFPDYLIDNYGIITNVDGEFEKDHESINAAVRYLREIYQKASISSVYRALHKGYVAYGRTWKFM